MALARKQRKATAIAVYHARSLGAKIPPFPIVVSITRIGPRRLDGDNLQAACKYVRDEIAKACGKDDGSALYIWLYDQLIGSRGQYGVDIEITERI